MFVKTKVYLHIFQIKLKIGRRKLDGFLQLDFALTPNCIKKLMNTDLKTTLHNKYREQI